MCKRISPHKNEASTRFERETTLTEMKTAWMSKRKSTDQIKGSMGDVRQTPQIKKEEANMGYLRETTQIKVKLAWDV